MNSKQKKNGYGRFVLISLAGLVGLCLILTAIFLVVNARRPQHSSITKRLNEQDKARLAEVFHLHQTLGDQVLPGWRQVPQGTQLGREWQVVPGDDFYETALLPSDSSSPWGYEPGLYRPGGRPMGSQPVHLRISLPFCTKLFTRIRASAHLNG